jgi:peptidoglycan/xylan/chitin deacetylase (PgdA/CDA1 family)
MIKLRNDDVLVDSGGGKYAGKEFERFRFIHEQILRTEGKMIHYPAIVCEELAKHPECLEYVREEVANGRMRPYLHGWDHAEDWTKKSEDEIRDMLIRCDDWFWDNLETEYDVWATPWGARSEKATKVAGKLGIETQSTRPTIDIKEAGKLVTTYGNADRLEGQIILYHWWQRGLSLFKIVECLVYGSVEKAKVLTTNPEWYK